MQRSPLGAGPERWWNLGSLLVVLIWTVSILLMLHGRNDLDLFLQAAQVLVDGGDPYARTYFRFYSYFYSPVFAWVVWPLKALGPVGSKVIWGLLSAAAALRTIQLLLSVRIASHHTGIAHAALRFLVLLMLLQSVRDNINLGQVTLLLVWCCVEGLHRIAKGQLWWGALLVAFALDMKLVPLVLLPYLAYRRYWRGLGAVLIGVLVLNALPLLVLGTETGMDLLRSRWSVIDPSTVRHLLDEEEPSMISWGSLLSAYLSVEGGNVNTLSLPRNIAQLSLDTMSILIWGGRALFALGALYFLRWPPFRAARTREHAAWEVAYLLLCCVLLFPHQRPYSLFLAAPALWWLCAYAVQRRLLHGAFPRIWYTLLTTVFIGLNAVFLVGEYAHIYDHYKLLSFVVLLLIGMLAWCTPERMHAVGMLGREENS